MARFAAILDPPFASRHVVDETGLAGGFDFTLDFSREILDSDTNQPRLNPRGALDMESAVMQAMPKQLGLRLVPKKALTEIMVIDRVEKDPRGFPPISVERRGARIARRFPDPRTRYSPSRGPADWSPQQQGQTGVPAKQVRQTVGIERYPHCRNYSQFSGSICRCAETTSSKPGSAPGRATYCLTGIAAFENRIFPATSSAPPVNSMIRVPGSGAGTTSIVHVPYEAFAPPTRPT